MTDCPARDQLALLLAEQLGAPEAERVEAHVQGCARCQAALDVLSGGGPTSSGAPAAGPEPRSAFLRQLREARPDADDRSGLADDDWRTRLEKRSRSQGGPERGRSRSANRADAR